MPRPPSTCLIAHPPPFLLLLHLIGFPSVPLCFFFLFRPNLSFHFLLSLNSIASSWKEKEKEEEAVCPGKFSPASPPPLLLPRFDVRRCRRRSCQERRRRCCFRGGTHLASRQRRKRRRSSPLFLSISGVLYSCGTKEVGRSGGGRVLQFPL